MQKSLSETNFYKIEMRKTKSRKSNKEALPQLENGLFKDDWIRKSFLNKLTVKFEKNVSHESVDKDGVIRILNVSPNDRSKQQIDKLVNTLK